MKKFTFLTHAENAAKIFIASSARGKYLSANTHLSDNIFSEHSSSVIKSRFLRGFYAMTQYTENNFDHTLLFTKNVKRELSMR
jgi:hypothetical protein